MPCAWIQKRKGLLYAGTERGVYVSFDDGANWQPMQLNLPVSPVHDLIVKDNDLAIATHGRAFWVLDDLSPLQQWNDGSKTKTSICFNRLPATTPYSRDPSSAEAMPAQILLRARRSTTT